MNKLGALVVEMRSQGSMLL